MKRLIFLIIFFVPSCAWAIWPIAWELNGERNFLGPLVTYRKDEVSETFTVRPFIFSYDSKEGGIYRFFYPLGKSTKDISYFLPLYLKKRDGSNENTGLFPIFWGKSNRGSYFGVFPFYGKLYERFNKDEMGFFLWPLFSYSESHGTKKTNILWPFFSFYSGDEEGFKCWPFFGYRERANISKSKFFLWPFFIMTERDLNTDDPFRSLFIIPFYIDGRSKKNEFTSILWPIYIKSKTEYKTQLDIFWPIFKKVEGEDLEGITLFPFYLYEKSKEDLKYSFMWPVYRSSEWYLGREKNISRSFLLLNRYIEDEKGVFLNIWPFFEYRGKEQNYSFYFPSVLPFRNEGLDIFLKPLITLYERKKIGNKVTSNLLYGLYTKEADKDMWRVRFAFLFEMKKERSGIGFELFSGLLGIEEKRIKLFFIPFERGKKEESP